jgi:ferredoxin-NADP reductase
MKAILEYVETLVPGVKTFWFRPEKRVHYVAGQFTEMYLPHNADERGQKRWFTLSSSPTEELLGITTKFVENGSSFKREMLRLIPGNKLDLAEPMGDFILPKDVSVPLLFIAGGMGITPFRSILKELSDKKEKRDVVMLYGAQKEEDLVFIDLITSVSREHEFIVSSPSSTWTGLSGHITLERIQSTADLSKVMIYFSGPEPMVEGFYKQLRDYGIPPHRLVMDYFPGYQSV